MQSNNALSNLKNRYKAVLKKCALINTFGSLALVAIFTMGGSVALELAQPNIAFGANISGTSSNKEKGENADASNFSQPDTPLSVSDGDAVFGGLAKTKNDGTASSYIGGTATANNNNIFIENASLILVTGGYAASTGANTSLEPRNGGAASANGNKVRLSRVDITSLDVTGGNAESIGGQSPSIQFALPGITSANSNIVILENGSSVFNVTGGRADSAVRPDSINKATAHYNEVIIDNSTVENLIVGGQASGNYNSTAHYNKITLKNSVTFGKGADTANILGGRFFDGGSMSSLTAHPNAFTGNTLILDNFTGTGTLEDIKNIANYSFILKSTNKANDTILVVEDLYLDDSEGSSAGTQSAQISSITLPETHNFAVGDTLTLIDYATIDGTLSNNNGIASGQVGSFLTADWAIEQTTTSGDGEINATLKEIKIAPTPQVSPAQSVADTQVIVGTTVLKSAGQAFASHGIAAAQESANNLLLSQLGSEQGLNAGSMAINKNVWAPFATVYGGYNSFDSSSKTDVTSLSFMGGLAHTSYFDKGELLLGALFEAGTGSYDSKANSGSNRIDSNGNLNYFGGGVFGRYDFYTAKGTPYLEASVRLGSINSDYDTNDIIDISTGSGVNYETNSMYYGLHIGAGYIFEIAKQWQVDVSAKYFWTHHESVGKEIGGNTFNFDSINSHVARLAIKTSYEAVNNGTYSFSPYLALAYEYEFDSNASASVDNILITSEADLQGSTGVLELGMQYKHSNGITLNFGVEGSLGIREGVNGKLEFVYEF